MGFWKHGRAISLIISVNNERKFMSVGERIKNRRIELGISQTQLAKKASLTSASISQFESGSRKPSFDVISKLALALEINTDYLLGNNHEKGKSVTIEPEYAEIISIIKELSEENKKLLLDFLEFAKYRNEQQKKR
jgi:transcriptional regulator with XRE-family HTH domain